MCKILDYALPKAYSDKLFGVDWNVYEKPFKETVDKLQTIKPEIKAEAAKAKSNKALAENVYSTNGTKSDNNGKPRVLDANKTTCKTCGKQHKGVCWDKDKGGNAGCNNRGGGNNSAFNKQQLKIVSKMVKPVTSKYPEPGMLMACWVRGKEIR